MSDHDDLIRRLRRDLRPEPADAIEALVAERDAMTDKYNKAFWRAENLTDKLNAAHALLRATVEAWERLSGGQRLVVVVERWLADDMAPAINAIRALVAEWDEDRAVIAVWRGRTQRAEAKLDAAHALLRDAMNWMPAQWPGENGRKLVDIRARINALLAEKEPTDAQ